MLGGDELVAGLGAQVFDVVDEKGVNERLTDQENNLCTARRKTSHDFSSYTSRSALRALVRVIN